jgi:DNA repair exonuclease SbcCD ATPase subunit
MKLIINKLFIKNFRSIGDSIEEIDLLKRGAVLICGMNGAGKTSIIEAIVWCLFGKLSDGESPGDNIINWDTGRNCMVKIATANGYEIIRTRKYEGYSDLLITKDGNPIEDGDSTNANAQSSLNNLFGLDFNSFISSLFFGQASGSFLTLSDSKKKLVIENLFGLSKLTYYANVAKERINKCDELHTSLKTKISDIEVSIKSAEEEIDKYRSLSKDFEEQRERTVREQQEEIVRLKENREELIDVETLKSSWEIIIKGNEKIDQLSNKKEELNSKLEEIINNSVLITRKKAEIEGNLKSSQRNIDQLQKRIKDWEQKKGTICPTCEQNVTKTFIDKKIKNVEKENSEEKKQLEKEIKEKNETLKNLNEQSNKLKEEKEETQNKINLITENIKKLRKSIDKAKEGKMTLVEAKKHNEIINGTDREIKKCEKLIKEQNNKINNYENLIKESEEKIEKFNKKIEEFKNRCEEIAKEATHLTYLYRAHSDKKNLRSFLISGSIPILNNRLSYYFNELNIQSDIRFNQSLQIKSNKWPYNLHSGGEKKRVDLALMCALYDTFTSIYGQKCNILVLDELDKEFDKNGVDEYVRLVIDDLSNRIDTILVISHKDEITYAFPTQIKVKKENDMSLLEQ